MQSIHVFQLRQVDIINKRNIEMRKLLLRALRSGVPTVLLTESVATVVLVQRLLIVIERHGGNVSHVSVDVVQNVPLYQTHLRFSADDFIMYMARKRHRLAMEYFIQHVLDRCVQLSRLSIQRP